MKKNKHYTISERKFFLRLLDLIFVIGTILLANNFFAFNYFKNYSSEQFYWFLTLGFYIIFFGQIFEMYNLRTSSSRVMIFKSSTATALFVTLLYIFTPILAPVLPANRLQILYLFFAILIPLILWRFVYISLVFLPKYHQYLLLVGSKEKIIDLIKLIATKAPDNKVIGYMCNEKIEEYPNYKYHNIENESIITIIKNNYNVEIVVSKSTITKLNKVNNELIQLFEQGTSIVSSQKFIESISGMVPEIQVDDRFYDYLTLSKNHHSNLYLVLVRTLDIIVALLGATFLIFILPIVFIGNLIANRGPLFYFQTRVGEKGENFKIIKLRSMVTNAEKDGAVWADTNDTRITFFGKFLRKSRLDEIPQFINILKGDMSLIGPRPERPEFVEQLQKEIPFYTIRHVVKPGLTGWAQVLHPYANTLEDSKLKVRYDLFYIKERSLLLDFKILIKTITTVLFFRGN